MGPLLRSLSIIRMIMVLFFLLISASYGFTTTRSPPFHHSKPVSTPLFASSDMMIQRGCQFYSIAFDFVDRPGGACPVVVLHGGPGVPSNYLRPLEDVIPDRSILFWDQLGCGKSDRPEDETIYSIDFFVDDLVQLMDTVLGEGEEFHLYGQSFGGILAFEYLQRERPDHCRSVILSSTPTNVAQVEGEADRLVGDIRKSGVPTEDIGEEFRKRHQVQTDQQPDPLAEAYQEAGTTFRGTTAIADYVADAESKIETPALILRGEKDFVTSSCVQGWKELFEDFQIRELKGCSHHGLLERPEEYADVLTSFWAQHEP
mmetsp:Transcript_106044/g.306721  ORF Transcript_106044/g.306721 Transcript_106044/m.306721 type:complete len:316 (+) Transcript_106044:197-1144(+)